VERKDTIVRTTCQLIDEKTDKVLAFGLSRTSASSKYRRRIGKEIAYAKAMQFLMLKIAGKMTIIDNTEREDG